MPPHLRITERRDTKCPVHTKLVLVVTHDTHTALMSHQRIVLRGGAVCSVVTRTDGEAALYKELGEAYHRQLHYQTLLRKGDTLA